MPNIGLNFGQRRQSEIGGPPERRFSLQIPFLHSNPSHNGSASHLRADAAPERRISMDHIRIPGLSKRKGSTFSGRASPNLEQNRYAALDLFVESGSTLVMFNPPAYSSGALFSASLKVNVLESDVVFTAIDIKLLSTIKLKRPVCKDCPECSGSSTELKAWHFAEQPLPLTKGMHNYPISYLFPGTLPATTHASLVQVDYHLAVVAKTSTGDEIKMDRNIELYRSILPTTEKHSIRVFQPTNLKAHVTLNPVVHPIGEFPVLFKLEGTTSKQDSAQFRWRIRKMNWRIEEKQQMLSVACPAHMERLFNHPTGVPHEETHAVGSGDINLKNTPIKTNYDAGEAEIEFKAVIDASRKPVCDVYDSEAGLKITHSLVVEMVVAEEWALDKRPRNTTPTGAARILRMSFNLLMTERGGLGVAWDEETPPVYDDVPPSPPAYYNTMEEFDLTELQDEEIQFSPRTSSHRLISRTAPHSPGPSSANLGSFQPTLERVRSASESGPPHIRITADDLLSEPYMPRRPPSTHENDDHSDPEH